MDCENAGWSDDRAAVTFMMGFWRIRLALWKSDDRQTANGKPLVSSSGCRLKTPCAVERAIVGDGIADGMIFTV